MMTSSAELRQAFLDFFADRGHQVVPSSSLIPAGDPTLLFTNAGMVQFKDLFLGRERRPYQRAVSSQRCVRAGGKHNDLENVGYTARHHTFFEMLGNFSFGDYFKREAIQYAWEFLTQVLRLPPERLWVTVFQDDDEAAGIWLDEVGVAPARFSRCGLKDNFWSMGDTGPCGPCSEIFYDHGPSVPGGPPGSPDEEGDRYIEIWNLVFMQYDRAADGTLTPLPRPSVDTGMGLERLAAVLQGVHSNYEIDLFQRLIRAAAAIVGTGDLENRSLYVIADHIRSCAFLVTDGVTPSNEGRGYVLRRIIRRALRHGYQLGLNEPFFHRLVEPLVQEMGAAFPELVEAQERVARVLRVEEERFAETLDQGMRIFDQAVAHLSGEVIPGETLFRLYDTYGFPVDLTADLARERNLAVDMAGFEEAMAGQRQRARAASHFGAAQGISLDLEGGCEFVGYDRLEQRATLRALFQEGQPRERLSAGESGMVVLDRTPFYAESGGQVGDKGLLRLGDAEFQVQDTRKQAGDLVVHYGQVRRGELRAGAEVDAEVDGALRAATALNHSATHLLHAALRRVLGEHVSQKGSLVDPERLRFDFSHFEPITQAQLQEIERLVNTQIRVNHPVETRVTSLAEAKAAGAMALFGEKYGDQVRVLRMGDFSTELCGGTHVRAAGDIGLFRIIAETGIAAGVRRIEALTGARAVELMEQEADTLRRIADLVHGDRAQIDERVNQVLDRNRKLEKEVEQLKLKLASGAGADLAAQAKEVAGVKVLAARLEGGDAKTLRDTLDQLKDKLGSAVILLAAVAGDRVNLAAGVTKDLTGKLPAGQLINAVADKVGGRGGGRPDLAQAGGNRPEGLADALAQVEPWVRERLGA